MSDASVTHPNEVAGEISCEQHNDILDRALLVSTVDGNGAEFFDGGL
jgi:hypothetical protein